MSQCFNFCSFNSSKAFSLQLCSLLCCDAFSFYALSLSLSLALLFETSSFLSSDALSFLFSGDARSFLFSSEKFSLEYKALSLCLSLELLFETSSLLGSDALLLKTLELLDSYSFQSSEALLL